MNPFLRNADPVTIGTTVGTIGLVHLGANVMQSYTAYKAIPESAPLITKVLSHPIVSIVTCLSPTLYAASAVAKLAGLIYNAGSKIAKDSEGILAPKNEEKVKGNLLHYYNVDCQMFWALNSFEYASNLASNLDATRAAFSGGIPGTFPGRR